MMDTAKMECSKLQKMPMSYNPSYIEMTNIYLKFPKPLMTLIVMKSCMVLLANPQREVGNRLRNKNYLYSLYYLYSKPPFFYH